MAVLTPAACVTAIAALIATVPKSGRVHTQRRIVRDEVSLKTHLWDEAEQRICAWMISPSPSTTTVTDRNPGHYGKGVKGGGNVMTTFQFQIEGMFGLDDAKLSESTWRDLAWAVADEFNAYGQLDIVGIVHQLPCDIEQFGYIAFAGSPLLHYARLSVGFQGRTRPAP
jgi:hypothetical protein